MKLTRAQTAYLKVIGQKHSLTCGWGGYDSTRVIWNLEAKGLVTVNPIIPQYPGDWTAQLTSAGVRELAKLEDGN